MVSPESYQYVSEDAAFGVQGKAIDRGYLGLPIASSAKTASWENLNELELLNSAGGSLQETHVLSAARSSFSNGMSGLSIGHMDSGENQTGTYFRGNNIGEAMQTLELRNSPYVGYGNPASHADNMVVVHQAASVVGQDNFLGHSNQLQQHYFGRSSSSSLIRNPISHQSTVNSVYSTAVVPQSSSQQTSLLLHELGSSTWAAGSELSFLPINETDRLTQPLSARLACMEPGQQQPNSNLSQLISRAEHMDQGPMFQHGTALGLTADDPHGSPGCNQGLSLSLSAHHNPFQMQCFGMQPGAAVLSNCQGLLEGLSEEGRRENGYKQQWVGKPDQLKFASQDNQLLPFGHFSGLGSGNKQLPIEIIGQAGSKYLRAAQVLLEEVVSLACGMKNSTKHTKLQCWIGSGSLIDSLSSQDVNAVRETEITPKEGVPCVVPTMQNAWTSSRSEQSLAVAERNVQENQELQLKKAKLMAMLDEVDRRYKLYFSQMEAVANTFEYAAGLGAAKTYTSLALQTISKHFRGLRDAIGSQIRLASRALGEDDSSLGLGRLHYVDQQLCQQRALHRFEMRQQHAWRPQRGLPERSVSVLRAWLFDHFLHPYPKDADKHMLARQTGLSRNQVSNWFINARVRLWKPMVEEMYLEELRESEMDRTSGETSTDQKSNTEASDNHRSGISSMDDRAAIPVTDNCNVHGQVEVGSKDNGAIQSDKQIVPQCQPLNSSVLHRSNGLDGQEVQLLQGILKRRSAGVFSPYDQGLKPEAFGREEGVENQSSPGFMSQGLDRPTYGSYFNQGEGFSRMPAQYSSVSLTLGLQHSAGISHADAREQLYLQQHQNHFQNRSVTDSLFSQLAMAGSTPRPEEIDHPCIDSAKNYEDLEEMRTRKRFASIMYNQD